MPVMYIISPVPWDNNAAHIVAVSYWLYIYAQLRSDLFAQAVYINCRKTVTHITKFTFGCFKNSVPRIIDILLFVLVVSKYANHVNSAMG